MRALKLDIFVLIDAKWRYFATPVSPSAPFPAVSVVCSHTSITKVAKLRRLKRNASCGCGEKWQVAASDKRGGFIGDPSKGVEGIRPSEKKLPCQNNNNGGLVRTEIKK